MLLLYILKYSLVLGQEFFLSQFLFDMKIITTQNCVYPYSVLKLLTRWPTVRSVQFPMILTDQCDHTNSAIYHQLKELTP